MSVQVEEGATVGEAILSCGIIETHPEINLGVNKVGVWNRTTKLETVLREGDRVEIYRPLIADPKEARRRRAEKAKDRGPGR